VSAAADMARVHAEERRIMNAWAPGYDAWMVSSSYVYARFRRAFARWVLEILRSDGLDPAALSILDAGCGTGALLAHLADPDVAEAGPRRRVGLDLAEGMLAESRRAAPGAHGVQGLIEAPPFAEDAFDAVVACWTLHHLADLGDFFRLCDRSLRPGGWFFVLDYDAAFAPVAEGGSRRSAKGDAVRALWARKNRAALARRPDLAHEFNPAHRLVSFAEIRRALGDRDYALRREVRGLLLPAFRDVLVEESALDRALARGLGALDGWLERRGGGREHGYLQWIAGRRAG